MTNAKRDAAAREFCKDWPSDMYCPNDLTLFYEKGWDARDAEVAELMAQVAEWKTKDAVRLWNENEALKQQLKTRDEAIELAVREITKQHLVWSHNDLCMAECTWLCAALDRINTLLGREGS